MPEEAQYAYMATQAALDNARLDADFIATHEVGIIYGNDSTAQATMEALDKFRTFRDTAAAGSGAVFRSMNSTVTMNLACLFHLRSLEACLRNARVTPREIGYINAHATSTLIGDSREAQAITRLLDGAPVPVTSTKSQTGHEMWMAGASEIIYSLLMMKNGFIAGSLNFEHPDPDSALLHILPETRETHFHRFLSNSFGFGGTNSTLLVQDLSHAADGRGE